MLKSQGLFYTDKTNTSVINSSSSSSRVGFKHVYIQDPTEFFVTRTAKVKSKVYTFSVKNDSAEFKTLTGCGYYVEIGVYMIRAVNYQKEGEAECLATCKACRDRARITV